MAILAASAGVFSKASHTLEKLWRTIVTPPLDLPQSGGGKVQISSGRLLRLLLEGMQHKNGILYFGDVKHSECPGLVADANFAHPLSYTRHRLPIARLKTLLHLVQLNAGFLSGCLREIPQLL